VRRARRAYASSLYCPQQYVPVLREYLRTVRVSCQHFHRLREAFARSAGPLAFLTTPDIRAQNDALRPFAAGVLGLGAGAFKLLPVAALYLARPLAVRPAPLLTGSFSPRPTDNDTLFFTIPSMSWLRWREMTLRAGWFPDTRGARRERQR